MRCEPAGVSKSPNKPELEHVLAQLTGRLNLGKRCEFVSPYCWFNLEFLWPGGELPNRFVQPRIAAMKGTIR